MYPGSYRRIIALGMGLVAVTSIAIVTAIWQLRVDAIRHSSRGVENIAKILAQQTSHSSQAIELVIDDILTELSRRRLNANQDVYRAQAAGQWAYDFLVDKLTRLPQADVATLTDADGRVLAITRGWPTPNVNLSDRDYFLHFREWKSRNIFISQPVQNKVTGTWTVYFSKRVETANGEFLGVVLIGVRPEFFIRAYDVISSIRGQSMLLLKKDGTILLRYPDLNSRTGGKITSEYGWYDLIKNNGGFYISPGIFDADRRIVNVQPIPGYDLAINVALLESEALASWREQALSIGVSAFFAQAAFLGLLFALRRIFYRQELTEFEIRKKSDELETSKEQLENSLSDYQYLAKHDHLCDILNRAAFIEFLDQTIQSRASARTALMLLDLDSFKEVNDVFGHHAGDFVLRKISLRISKCIGLENILARLGGDEFAVLMVDCVSVEALNEKTLRLLEAIRTEIPYEENLLRVGVSIGVVMIDQACLSPEIAMKRADIALYEAKASGKNCARVFDRAMEEKHLFRRQLASQIRTAIDRQDIYPVYQPIVNAKTYQVAGMEALLRWKHETRGFVSPLVVVEVAEEAGLMNVLGEYIMKCAIRDAMTWHQSIGVSVNVSATQLNAENFPEFVEYSLRMSGIDPRRVTLEITENGLIRDYGLVNRNLDYIRSLGVTIALDDFGTGYSSLSYLQSLSFQKIKIDKSFVDSLDNNVAATIVRSVVGISRAVGSETVAEGIEDLAQALQLQKMGVDYFQGYLFGKPLKASEWNLREPLSLAPTLLPSNSKAVAQM